MKSNVCEICGASYVPQSHNQEKINLCLDCYKKEYSIWKDNGEDNNDILPLPKGRGISRNDYSKTEKYINNRLL